jgi:hypothetical protein
VGVCEGNTYGDPVSGGWVGAAALRS